MRPLELTATPSTSPRFMSAEYLKKSGTESNGIFGTLEFCIGGGCCAETSVTEPLYIDCNSATITSAIRPNDQRFTLSS